MRSTRRHYANGNFPLLRNIVIEVVRVRAIHFAHREFRLEYFFVICAAIHTWFVLLTFSRANCRYGSCSVLLLVLLLLCVLSCCQPSHCCLATTENRKSKKVCFSLAGLEDPSYKKYHYGNSLNITLMWRILVCICKRHVGKDNSERTPEQVDQESGLTVRQPPNWITVLGDDRQNLFCTRNHCEC